MDHQYRENGARNVYSNHNQMRAYAECSPNQSKKLYLIDLSFHRAIDETLKIPAVSVSEFYQSTLQSLSILFWLGLGIP